MTFRYYICLIVLATYSLLWAVLFVFPLCKKKNPIIIDHGDCDIILGAHRGGSLERMENTVPAFVHAKEWGMHILEMDVQLTQDKKVVVHHDESLVRITGVDRKVSEMDYADLPPLLDVISGPFPGQSYTKKPGIDDAKIPLLGEVFEVSQNIPINIDLKGGSSELMLEVYKLIVEYNREEITYFGDMNEARNVTAQEMGKEVGIRTFASIGYTFWTVICYFLGILQFCRFRHHSIWFPFFSQQTLQETITRLGGKWYHKCIGWLFGWLTFCMKPMFWHLRRRRILVMFWTVDSEAEYARANTYPIDGILTDIPQDIRRIADNRSRREGGSGSGEQMMQQVESS